MITETKPSKGQQTREQLIEVAFEQFTRNGFHGASMRKIAEQTGLALGGIYNHFASKDEMFKAVILAYHPLTLIMPEMASAQGESGEALIRDAAHRFYQSLAERPDLLNLLFIELIECQGRHLSELISELLPDALRFAQRLATSEDIVAEKSPFVIVRVFVGALIGYILTESILGRIDLATHSIGTLDDFLDLILHGLVKK